LIAASGGESNHQRINYLAVIYEVSYMELRPLAALISVGRHKVNPRGPRDEEENAKQSFEELDLEI